MSLAAAAEYLSHYGGPPLRIMEVCGTHTAAIFRSGIRSLLAPGIRLVSGPGCPVCVTPSSYIDRCVEYAATPGFRLMSFGDMMKTPGSGGRAIGGARGGGRVEMMYSPMEAVERAALDPSVTYVIAAVGFETTIPAYALAIEEAAARGLGNLRLLTALKSVTPALEWLLENERGIDGFICPGHVSVITGPEAYERLATGYGKPFAVAGFEGEHILAAIYAIARLAGGGAGGAGSGRVLNLYPSAVRAGGNARALALIAKYFEPGPAVWRGLGRIEGSGYYLRKEYARFDGGGRGLDGDEALAAGCACAGVTAGRTDPGDCPMFGSPCRPESPLGPCMASAEGACGVWFQNM
ncbi:MAG: hydrogenase formation protein HypD [Clostridiales Family XIII bacterium]|jgi:hydrogenase expression/formation protein HypD|nr:hydrogenase formation protein HypD [Clostridiales Family XIII bacterium]